MWSGLTGNYMVGQIELINPLGTPAWKFVDKLSLTKTHLRGACDIILYICNKYLHWSGNLSVYMLVLLIKPTRGESIDYIDQYCSLIYVNVIGLVEHDTPCYFIIDEVGMFTITLCITATFSDISLWVRI